MSSWWPFSSTSTVQPGGYNFHSTPENPDLRVFPSKAYNFHATPQNPDNRLSILYGGEKRTVIRKPILIAKSPIPQEPKTPPTVVVEKKE
jgi:hypothetical protein